MIPKQIHYVWLSGEEKPKLVKDCLESWKTKLPNYEVKEWTMDDVKNISSEFLHDAIAARKWAFATDYLRFYIIYHFGGIYMDSDVYVYRSFDPLLDCNGFTSLEESGILCTEQGKLQNFGLEAAVFGAMKGSPWIKNILDFYATLRFKNTSEFCLSIMAPKVMWKRTLPFGLRQVPSFQVLDGRIKIYGYGCFSCIVDERLFGLQVRDYERYGEIDPTRIACHLGLNSWGWQGKKTIKDKLKENIIKLIGAEKAVRYKRNFKAILGHE